MLLLVLTVLVLCVCAAPCTVGLCSVAAAPCGEMVILQGRETSFLRRGLSRESLLELG